MLPPATPLQRLRVLANGCFQPARLQAVDYQIRGVRGSQCAQTIEVARAPTFDRKLQSQPRLALACLNGCRLIMAYLHSHIYAVVATAYSYPLFRHLSDQSETTEAGHTRRLHTHP